MPVLDRDRARADRIQQGPIVRHEQKRPWEFTQGVLERLPALDVEVIRGLVQDQHVGRPRRVHEDRQGEPAQLAAESPSRGFSAS